MALALMAGPLGADFRETTMKKLSYKKILELPPRTPLGAQDFYNAAENQLPVEYDFGKHCFVRSASSKMILSVFYIEYFYITLVMNTKTASGNYLLDERMGKPNLTSSSGVGRLTRYWVLPHLFLAYNSRGLLVEFFDASTLQEKLDAWRAFYGAMMDGQGTHEA